ncbi:MAG: flagellar basal body rod protein FlgB [Halanaerobiales bacterium]|nr:flagellar basal body rod protein FlgB [Halanaerobiales bacterium]
MWDKLDNTLKVLGTGLDGSALRQKILANNLANVDTPNFKGQDVKFYSQLKSNMNEPFSLDSLSLAKTNSHHLAGTGYGSDFNGGFQVSQTSGQVRADGNNVNVDVEMAKMAENTIYYNTLVSTVAAKYKKISQVISKGGDR